MILGKPLYEFPFSDYLQMEMALLAMQVNGQQVKPPNEPLLKRAYDVILAIREIAEQYAAPVKDFPALYLPGLLLYNLAVLKYERESGSNAARLSFATATLIGKKLDG